MYRKSPSNCTLQKLLGILRLNECASRFCWRPNELLGVKVDDLKMPLLRTSSVRIGQLTGPEQSGTWSETEHFPIIVRTSQIIKALPERSQCFQHIFYFAPCVFSNDYFW
jgi:hypothetical protein